MIDEIVPAKPHIDVLAEDITKGLPGSAYACPIALAIKRTFPEFEEIEVDGARIRIFGMTVSLYGSDTHYHAIYAVPEDAVEFQIAFDRGLAPIEPFGFDMELVTPEDSL